MILCHLLSEQILSTLSSSFLSMTRHGCWRIELLLNSWCYALASLHKTAVICTSTKQRSDIKNILLNNNGPDWKRAFDFDTWNISHSYICDSSHIVHLRVFFHHYEFGLQVWSLDTTNSIQSILILHLSSFFIDLYKVLSYQIDVIFYDMSCFNL